MLSLRSILAFSVLAITACLPGLTMASMTSPPDTPGMGDGSASATQDWEITVGGQNKCGYDIHSGTDSISLPIDDCINLRNTYSDNNNTGTYTYTWNTPGDVPADTDIYGPWYGDCMILFVPFDYTQSFS